MKSLKKINSLSLRIYPILFSMNIFMYGGQLHSQSVSCSSPEASQFDFWLGEWKLDWKNEKGETESGTNFISKSLGGCVVEENFSTSDKTFSGRSFSVYNANKSIWQQTWVDNSGAYMDFTGEFAGGKMILLRKIMNKQGKEMVQRMVFYDIQQNELWWNWESSADEGKTWKLLWKIHYVRK
jgi:hypothetical protein